MQRGFKSQCEQISRRYRKALGLALDDAMPYGLLAEHLRVRLWNPHDIPGLEEKYVHQLTVVDKHDWSAVTVNVSGKSVVIMNSSHSERRLANDVVHELAHIILDHRKARLDVSDDGHMWLRTYSNDQEEEADWLAGALLLPRDGLLKVYRECRDDQIVADNFLVSVDLARMRINRTGIRRQVDRSSYGR